MLIDDGNVAINNWWSGVTRGHFPLNLSFFDLNVQTYPYTSKFSFGEPQSSTSITYYISYIDLRMIF